MQISQQRMVAIQQKQGRHCFYVPKHKHKNVSYKIFIHANAQFQSLAYFAWMGHDTRQRMAVIQQKQGYIVSGKHLLKIF